MNCRMTQTPVRLFLFYRWGLDITYLTIYVYAFTGLSLEDLGMKALSKLPRDQAIEGIRAFQAMR